MTYHLCDVRVRIHIAVTLCYVLFLRVLFLILLSGSVVEVFTATNILTGLFYQDSFMTKSCAAYPEMIFIDSTYKMGENRTALYILVVVDSNGEKVLKIVYHLSSIHELSNITIHNRPIPKLSCQTKI